MFINLFRVVMKQNFKMGIVKDRKKWNYFKYSRKKLQ